MANNYYEGTGVRAEHVTPVIILFGAFALDEAPSRQRVAYIAQIAGDQ